MLNLRIYLHLLVIPVHGPRIFSNEKLISSKSPEVKCAVMLRQKLAQEEKLATHEVEGSGLS